MNKRIGRKKRKKGTRRRGRKNRRKGNEFFISINFYF